MSLNWRLQTITDLHGSGDQLASYQEACQYCEPRLPSLLGFTQAQGDQEVFQGHKWRGGHHGEAGAFS